MISGERPAASADPSASSGLACDGAERCEFGGRCRLWEPLRMIRERQAAWRTAVLCACPVHTRELDQVVFTDLARFVSLRTGHRGRSRTFSKVVLSVEGALTFRGGEQGQGEN